MKLCKFFLVILIIASILTSINSVGATTWDESKNLSEAEYSQIRPCIAVNEDIIHIVWEDNAKGSIQYIRSVDGGNTWQPAIKLMDSNDVQQDPDIAVYGDNVYVVWEDQRNSATTGSDIYFIQSEDGGVNWKAEEQLTINQADQWKRDFIQKIDSKTGAIKSPFLYVLDIIFELLVSHLVRNSQLPHKIASIFGHCHLYLLFFFIIDRKVAIKIPVPAVNQGQISSL